MMRKINSNYQKEVTVESVVEKVRFLKKLKYPFIVIIFINAVLMIVWAFFERNGLYTIVLFAIWLIVFILNCVGFLVYGRKLVSLMPKDIVKKVRRVRNDRKLIF